MEYGLLAYIYKFFAYNIEENIEAVKSVDLFFDQFTTQDEGGSDGRANPRVLIEIVPFEPIQRMGQIQEWEGRVILHIGIDITNTFYSGSELLEKNLGYLALLDSIYQKLSYTSAYNLPEDIRSNSFIIQQVSRTALEMSTDTGGIKVSKVEFNFIVEDYSKVNTPIEGTIDNVITTYSIDK